MEDQTKFKLQVKAIYRMLLGIFGIFAIAAFTILVLLSNPQLLVKSKPGVQALNEGYSSVPAEDDYDKIENGIHVRTGLVDAEGLMTVVNNCTNCHSAKLVTQNKMNEERWISTIRWMQETQNLWDLGPNEEIIVNYLVTNYPPTKKGRRENLKDIEWYTLN
ncbi:monoheme cytochrome C [Maribacter polysaccharolyticus]|uniref:monoheme cytochrome C n=1 Tax=Maribacter polysaccharolyticus TaxID=3020831 RepID=UPI00237F55FE|nr:monoheme cytochrome C [Maribacter polysaccharolyticus]MDE3740894.1 monoheme cytochrome C [Maribacter polysaccharolyticus]